MSGIVHFKFKSALTYDSVQFDGAFVTVGELKALIAEKKGIGRDATSELVLSDARSKVEFKDDAHMVAKSSSVLVRRVPAVRHQPMEATPAEPQAVAQPAPAAGPSRPALSPSRIALGLHPRSFTRDEDFGGDLYAERPSAPAAPEPVDDEEKALQSMLAKKGQDYQRDLTARGRGRGGRGGRGRGRGDAPSSFFKCYRCGELGHFAGDCPTNGDPAYDKKVRMPSGIPMSRLALTGEGGLLLPGGQKGCLLANEESFAAAIEGFPTLDREPSGDGQGSESGSEKPALAGEDQQMVLYDSGGPGPSASAGPPAAMSNAMVPVGAMAPSLIGENFIFPDSFEEPASEMVLAQRPPPRAVLPPIPPHIPPPIPQPGGFWNMPPLVGNMFQPPVQIPAMSLPPQEMVPQGPAHYVLQAFAPVMAGPLSKDDFARMQEEARRKAARRERSRSRSRSRSRGRRRWSRSSSRDRREDGRRRHRSRSRDRDSSRDRHRRREDESARTQPQVLEEFDLALGMEVPDRPYEVSAAPRAPRLPVQTFGVNGMHGGPLVPPHRGAPNGVASRGRRNGLGLPGSSGLSLLQQGDWAGFADDGEDFLQGPGERLDLPRYPAQRQRGPQDGGRYEPGPSLRTAQYGAGGPLLLGEDYYMPSDAAGACGGVRSNGRAAMMMSRSGVVGRDGESQRRRRGADAAQINTRKGNDFAANGSGRASRAVPSEGDRHRERDGTRHSVKDSRRREPKDDRRHEPKDEKRRRPREARQPEPAPTKQQTPEEKKRSESKPKPQQTSEEKRSDPELDTQAPPKARGQHAPTVVTQHEAKGERAAVIAEEVLPAEAKATAGEHPQVLSPAGDLPIPEAAEGQSPVEERLARENEKSKKRKKEKKEKKERRDHRKRSRKEYAGSGSPEPALAYLPSMENGGGSASPRPSRGHSFGHEAAPLVLQRSIHDRLGHTRWAPEEDVVYEDDGGPQILKRLGRTEEAIGVEGYDEEERPSKHRRRHRHEGDTAKHGAGKSRSDSLFARALVAAVSKGPSAGTARYRTMR